MSSLTIAPTARKLGRKAVVSPVGLELIEGLKFELWVQMGRQILGAQDTSRWWLADWLFYGETEYGRKYREALDFTGLDYQTLMDLNYVAGRIDFSRRRENLSFSHHREVTPLEPAEQDRWLTLAEENEWSHKELREHLGAEREVLPRTTVSMRRLVFSAPEERAHRWEEAAERAGQPFEEWAADALDQAAA